MGITQPINLNQIFLHKPTLINVASSSSVSCEDPEKGNVIESTKSRAGHFKTLNNNKYSIIRFCVRLPRISC